MKISSKIVLALFTLGFSAGVASARDSIQPGAIICDPGVLMVSANGYWTAEFRKDWNFIVYPTGNHNPRWVSNTQGRKCCIVMDDGGAFYVRVQDGSMAVGPIRGGASAYLKLCDDGHLHVITPRTGQDQTIEWNSYNPYND